MSIVNATLPVKRSYYVVLNARSGTAAALGLTAEALCSQLEQAGHQVSIDADDETPFQERIASALASKHDVIVAVGGDGTVSALDSALVASEKILAVLPLGTVNSLAKDLKMPLEVDSWIASLSEMEPRSIDVGEVNGRIFLHMVVIGLIPGMAAGREALRGRSELRAKLGLMRYFLRRLSRARRLAVQIDPSNEAAKVQRVQAVAVTCNAFEEGFGRFLARKTLDAGELTVYQLKHLGWADVLRLAGKMLLGKWQQDEALSILKTSNVTIRSHKPRLQVMLDGEIESIAVPLEFRVRSLALRVLASPTPGDAAQSAESGMRNGRLT